MNTATVLLGLIRDVIVAVIGLVILFGVDITNAQTGGILLLVSTVFALGSFVWVWYSGRTK